MIIAIHLGRESNDELSRFDAVSGRAVLEEVSLVFFGKVCSESFRRCVIRGIEMFLSFFTAYIVNATGKIL